MALSMIDNDFRLQLEATLRAELQALTTDLANLDKYRDYYSGDQTLAYGTARFKEMFGDSFQGFRDNWCDVVVDAVNDKLTLTGVQIGRSDAEIAEFADLSNRVWTTLLNNDLDEQQTLHHEGALVEGRSYMIVWPDEELGARVDWQPAQIVTVRYDDLDPRRVLWAVKRWVGQNGQVFANLYRKEGLYKFQETQGAAALVRKQVTALDQKPDSGSAGGWEPREVPGETWPLPNPFNGIVPVLEYFNKSGQSEIFNVIPQQDALNYILLQMMVTGEYQAYNQRGIVSRQSAPVGGWKNGPGEIWHLKPSLDPDGKVIPTEFLDFDASDPGTYVKVVELFLQHIALSSKTPVRYFMQSDRGGRGDAPSGESLKYDDKPLNDKVIKRQVAFGNRHYKLVKLVAQAISPDARNNLPFGEVLWVDPRTEYRMAALTEGLAMFQLGIPLEFIVKKLGFTKEENEEITRLIEEARDSDEGEGGEIEGSEPVTA